MKTIIKTLIDLSDEIFIRRLNELTQGLWENKGRMWEEQKTHTSWNQDVGDANDPKFEIIIAALNLKRLLSKERCPNGYNTNIT